MARRLQVPGPGGRRLEVELSGPDDGHVVVFHSGTPDAGTMFEPLVAVGAERGIRHVAYSRPGYAKSDRHEGRSVGDCAQDTAAILDHLGIDRAFMVGVSGGGPHSLACAALLPHRTLAAASVAGVAPWNAEGLDWTAGMGQENLDEFAAIEAGPEALRDCLERQRAELMRATSEQVVETLGDLLSVPDRAVLTGAFAEHLARSCAEAVSDGVWGWFDDDVAIVGDWGFELGSITRPVSIWQGREDRFVPVAHGEWLARRVPGASAQIRDGEGHLTIAVGSYAEILDDLLASAG